MCTLSATGLPTVGVVPFYCFFTVKRDEGRGLHANKNASPVLERQPAATLHAFLGTTCQEPSGSPQLPSQALNPTGKKKSFRLTNCAQQHSEQGFQRCVRTAEMKKCLRFQSMTQRSCPSQGFSGIHTAMLHLKPENGFHLTARHSLLPSGADQSMHMLSVSPQEQRA